MKYIYIKEFVIREIRICMDSEEIWEVKEKEINCRYEV